MYENNPYKNSSGAYYLKALFYEENVTEDKEAIRYTLKQEDHKGYPSIHRLYLEVGDLTEYKFAKQYFDGYTHWKKLCECTWFKPYLREMREELEIKIRSEALSSILEAATKTTRDSFNIQKYLLDGAWRDKDPKGRPSKEKIKQQAEEMFEARKDTAADYDRIFLPGTNRLNG